MPEKFDKGAYDMAYMKKNIITKTLQFNRRKPEDMMLLEHAESRGNFNQYVKGLIQTDMEQGPEEGKQD